MEINPASAGNGGKGIFLLEAMCLFSVKKKGRAVLLGRLSNIGMTYYTSYI